MELHQAEASPLMTPAEVLHALNISRATLDNWVKAGHLAAVYLPGGHRRFSREHVAAIATGEAAS